MKRIVNFLSIFLILAGSGFAQNSLTPDQIRRYANELGVPYEALQRLVDSHRIQTGLSNPNARTAQFYTIEELDFLSSTGKLEIGSFYRTRAINSFRDGNVVVLRALSGENNGSFDVVIDSLLNIQRDAIMDVLISVRPSRYGRNEPFIVEAVLVR